MNQIYFSGSKKYILLEQKFAQLEFPFTFAAASLIRPAPANPPGWEHSKGMWLSGAI